MNDESSQLERQLEAATAPSDAEPSVLDAQTASLREGWLALGQLLDAAEASLDEPSGRWRLPQRRRAPHRHSSTVALLAASLLVAATTAWLVLRPDAARPPMPGPAEVAVETPQPAEPKRPSPERPVRSPAVENKAAESRYAWDDSLDDQLVSAAQAVMSVQEDWSLSTASADYLRYGLEQVEAEFDSGSL